MYFEDLSPYFDYENVFAIGWLDRSHNHAIGVVPDIVSYRLSQMLILKKDINKMRGTHVCPFCGADKLSIRHGDATRMLGMSELWIPGEDDIIYAVPTLILHYITTHEYSPPIKLVNAILQYDFNREIDGESLMSSRLPK